jgi:CRP-like cAMP-binding protein
MENRQSGFESLKTRIRALININDADLEAIVNRFEYRNTAKNDFLLKEGGRCDFWGFVDIGLMRVYSHINTGEEYTNGFAKEGGFITESMSFFTQSASLENFIAIEDTTIICISPLKLKRLYEDFPVFERFSRILYETRMVEIKARILYRVQLDAQSRYLNFIKTQPELIKRVPLKYIASYLSITDSTLSRIRRKTLHTSF